MIKGVVFDFNGTLFADSDKHVKAWDALARELRGKGLSEEEFYHHLNGVPNQQIILYLTEGQADDAFLAACSQKKEQYYRQFCREDTAGFHLVKGAEALFAALKQADLPFTIASASIWENMQFFIESFHLDSWMDPRQIVYDDGSYASKVGMYQKALEHLRLAASETLAFEDSFSGIHDAYEAGISQIIVRCLKEEADQFAHLPGVIATVENFDNCWEIMKKMIV